MKNFNLDLLLVKLSGTRFGGPKPSVVVPRDDQLLKDFTADNVPNPFKDLPNVRSSSIKCNSLDPLLAACGIASALSPEMSFEQLSGKLKACNRYLRIMHFRLLKMLSHRDHYGFWILALQYLKRSKVLRLVALRKFNHNWHTQLKLGTVKLILQSLDKQIQDFDPRLTLKRDYANKVKPDGTITYRPIGNPKYHNRMFLYLLQSFMVTYMSSFIGKYQHGFMPARGTLTA
jgi:hypothetical protein